MIGIKSNYTLLLTNPIVDDKIRSSLEIHLKKMKIIPGKQRNAFLTKAAIVFALISIFAFNKADFAFAQYYENGEEEVSQIIVDKTIKGLAAGQWVDNYSSNEMIFGPDDVFDYKIVIKNEGNRNQTWIKVTDTLPAYLKVIFGYDPDKGDSFNDQTRELTYKIPEIKPGEESSRVIRVQVKEKSEIPSDITRITNKVCAQAESGAQDCDQAIAYIGKGEKMVEAIPETGNKEIVIGSLIGLGIIGLATILRKVGRGEFLKK